MARIIRHLGNFTADRAWGARELAEIDGVTIRIHWTDKPYKWHVNDGAEVFLILDGTVEMRYRDGGMEKTVTLKPNDAFVADVGDEHVAHPIGEARILVVERKGSI